MYWIDDINNHLRSNYKTPDKIMYGYRFWFRDFIQSACSNTVVGFVFAWPEYPQSSDRYFVCPVGAEPFEYVRGQRFTFDEKVIPLLELEVIKDKPLTYMRELKDQTVQKLVDFVGEKV